jgi:hypothetical protein
MKMTYAIDLHEALALAQKIGPTIPRLVKVL